MTEGLQVRTVGDREIVLTRAFAAPARLVFAALTTPELVKRWLGAREWNVTDAQIDLRIGGAWRFVSRGPQGQTMAHGGVYREIVTPTRLVYTEVFDDQSFPGESLITTVLVEAQASTTMTTNVLLPAPKVREYVLSTPMERGVGHGYQRLDDLLRALQGDERDKL
ncbi:ATPase [Rhizocola hellebori]|uniref:ATPase n=1 Tax=Rhizocola hellebori TaxID=1392758 RepID=A0A8J3VK20_9ACTN|nr:SRPBCC family protein [Rhizocola hellebori]GIH09984.1 ATPase [Rhizocola hellebori]